MPMRKNSRFAEQGLFWWPAIINHVDIGIEIAFHQHPMADDAGDKFPHAECLTHQNTLIGGQGYRADTDPVTAEGMAT